MELLKRKFLLNVDEDLRTLNGTEFEYFCKEFLGLLINDEVIHKGHNLYAKPVRLTTDFNNVSYDIVAQVGTDNNYFESYKKPLHDIIRATQISPQCKTIYIFSNMLASGGQLSDLDKEIKKIKGIQKYKVEIFDTKRIGEKLHNNILIWKVEELVSQLPSTYELYKVLPETNQIPNYRNRYFERKEEIEVIGKLQHKNVVQVYGISGIGKSELTKAVAKKLQKEFDSFIWINADLPDNKVINFSSIKVEKFDSKINISELIKLNRIFIIIDNLNNDVEATAKSFEQANQKESKLLITSLQKNLKDENTYKLGFLDDIISKEILKDTTHPATDVQQYEILKKVNGYPLALNLIKKSVENEEFTWSDIINELNNIHYMGDENCEKICDRIIGRYIGKYNEEFGLIKYLDNTLIHKAFMQHALGKVRVGNICKTAIINDLGTYFSIHQLIFDSIIKLIDNTNCLESYNTKLRDYLLENNIRKTTTYYNFIFNHKDLLNKLYERVNNDLKAILLYALINSSDYFAEEEAILEKIKSLNLDIKDYYSLALIIEKYEIELFMIKSNERESYESKASEALAELIKMCAKYNKSDEKLMLLYHHIGKIYYWIKDYGNAEMYFNLVMENNADHYPVRLQLARLYTENKKYKDAIRHIEYVLNRSALDEIPLTILLSFYELLMKPSYSTMKDKYIKDNIEEFIEVILKSLHSGFDHPYRVIEKFSRDLSYNYPEYFKNICDNIPFPDNIRSNNMLKIAYAQIQASYFIFLKYSNIERKELKMLEAYTKSETAFLNANLNNDYNRKQLIDLYIAVEEYEKANDIYNTIEDKENVFNLQLKCKIYRGMCNHKVALESIQKAIDIKLASEEHDKYLSSFYHDKAEILYKDKHISCIDVLKEAIAYQDVEKTKNIWLMKLNTWYKEFHKKE